MAAAEAAGAETCKGTPLGSIIIEEDEKDGGEDVTDANPGKWGSPR